MRPLPRKGQHQKTKGGVPWDSGLENSTTTLLGGAPRPRSARLGTLLPASRSLPLPVTSARFNPTVSIGRGTLVGIQRKNLKKVCDFIRLAAFNQSAAVSALTQIAHPPERTEMAPC